MKCTVDGKLVYDILIEIFGGQVVLYVGNVVHIHIEIDVCKIGHKSVLTCNNVERTVTCKDTGSEGVGEIFRIGPVAGNGDYLEFNAKTF